MSYHSSLGKYIPCGKRKDILRLEEDMSDLPREISQRKNGKMDQLVLTSHEVSKVYVPSLKSKKGGTILSEKKKRIIDIGKLGINHSTSIGNVLLVDGSKHNMLSISQSCDS